VEEYPHTQNAKASFLLAQSRHQAQRFAARSKICPQNEGQKKMGEEDKFMASNLGS